MSKPHKCPVCEGGGQMQTLLNSTNHQDCHACKGTGIVWEPEPKSVDASKPVEFKGDPYGALVFAPICEPRVKSVALAEDAIPLGPEHRGELEAYLSRSLPKENEPRRETATQIAEHIRRDEA